MFTNKNILFIILLFLSIAIAFAPALFGWDFTRAQAVTLAIFSLAIFLWVSEAVPLYVTSFLILFAEVVFLFPLLKEEGVMKKASAFYHPFFSDIIALFMGGLILARAGSKYHVDQWISQTVLRYSSKRADYVLLSMMATAAILSMWMSNTAATAMLLIIATRMIDSFQDNKKMVSAFLLGIPFAANLGGMATPVGTPPNAIALSEMQTHGINISFAGWMLAVLPLVIILFFFLWLLLRNVYGFKNITIESPKNSVSGFTLDSSTIIVMFVFAVTVVLWFFSGQIGVSSGMIALLPTIVFLGFRLLDKSDFRSISWDVLFLVGGGGSLSVALDNSGLGEKFIFLLPVSLWGTLITLLFFMLLAAIMTSFMSNTATANILIPLVFALDKGSDSAAIAIVSTLAMSSTMLLPVSTPPNALAYSSGMVNSRQMVKIGFVLALVATVLFFFIGLPWWRFLGIME